MSNATEIPSSPSYAKRGNIFHVTALINVLFYAALILKYAHPNIDQTLFDQEWLKNGFCVSNFDTPYANSHDLCLYADTICAILVIGIYYALRDGYGIKDDKSLQHVFKWSSVSILTHGLAHGFIAHTIRQKKEQGEDIYDRVGVTGWDELIQKHGDDMSSIYLEILTKLPMGILFWFPLLRSGVKPIISHVYVMTLTMIVIAVQYHVQYQFGFTYVQTVIFLVFGADNLLATREEKSKFSYMVLAFVGIPLSIVPYWEAMGCNSGGYKALGGHALYDVSIPVCGIGAYLACYAKGQQEYRALKKDV